MGISFPQALEGTLRGLGVLECAKCKLCECAHRARAVTGFDHMRTPRDLRDEYTKIFVDDWSIRIRTLAATRFGYQKPPTTVTAIATALCEMAVYPHARRDCELHLIVDSNKRKLSPRLRLAGARAKSRRAPPQAPDCKTLKDGDPICLEAILDCRDQEIRTQVMCAIMQAAFNILAVLYRKVTVYMPDDTALQTEPGDVAHILHHTEADTRIAELVRRLPSDACVTVSTRDLDILTLALVGTCRLAWLVGTRDWIINLRQLARRMPGCMYASYLLALPLYTTTDYGTPANVGGVQRLAAPWFDKFCAYNDKKRICRFDLNLLHFSVGMSETARETMLRAIYWLLHYFVMLPDPRDFGWTDDGAFKESRSRILPAWFGTSAPPARAPHILQAQGCPPVYTMLP